MTSELEQRFKRATAWAHGPISWAVRFRLVSRAMDLQLFFLLLKK